MKEFDLLNAMNELDKKYLLEAEQPAVKVRKSKKIWKRPAVIAACMCLALTGTVLAAANSGFILQFFDTNERFTSPDERETSPIVGGHWASSSVRVPVAELSDEVKALEESGEHRHAFNSWAEMESAIGLDVVNNSLLDKLAKARVDFLNFDDQGDRMVHAYMLVYSDLKQIDMTANYEMYGTFYVGITASIATDRLEEDRTGGVGYSYTDEMLASSTQEEYTMANGQTAFIFYGPMLQEGGSTSEETLFKAYFQGDNALITLSAHDSREWAAHITGLSGMTEEELKAINQETLKNLKRVLDAFE